jgi:hypothetical protein
MSIVVLNGYRFFNQSSLGNRMVSLTSALGLIRPILQAAQIEESAKLYASKSVTLMDLAHFDLSPHLRPISDFSVCLIYITFSKPHMRPIPAQSDL